MYELISLSFEDREKIKYYAINYYIRKRIITHTDGFIFYSLLKFAYFNSDKLFRNSAIINMKKLSKRLGINIRTLRNGLDKLEKIEAVTRIYQVKRCDVTYYLQKKDMEKTDYINTKKIYVAIKNMKIEKKYYTETVNEKLDKDIKTSEIKFKKQKISHYGAELSF